MHDNENISRQCSYFYATFTLLGTTSFDSLQVTVCKIFTYRYQLQFVVSLTAGQNWCEIKDVTWDFQTDRIWLLKFSEFSLNFVTSRSEVKFSENLLYKITHTFRPFKSHYISLSCLSWGPHLVSQSSI